MGPRDGVQACSSLSPEGSIWDLVREAGVSGLLSGHTYLKTFFRVLWCEQRIGPCSASGTDALRKPLPQLQLQVQGGASTVWPHPVFCLELLFLLNPTPPSPCCRFRGLMLGGLGRAKQ